MHKGRARARARTFYAQIATSARPRAARTVSRAPKSHGPLAAVSYTRARRATHKRSRPACTLRARAPRKNFRKRRRPRPRPVALVGGGAIGGATWPRGHARRALFGSAQLTHSASAPTVQACHSCRGVLRPVDHWHDGSQITVVPNWQCASSHCGLYRRRAVRSDPASPSTMVINKGTRNMFLHFLKVIL